MVVMCFWFREGPTTTRLGTLVVRPVVSCLRVVDTMGMTTGNYGSEVE